MQKRIINVNSGKYKVQMEVTEDQYHAYYRPWWNQQKRAERNREAMKKNGYTTESYENWKNGQIDSSEVNHIQNSVEDIAEKQIILELLNEALDLLLPEEKELAVLVLGEEMSLSEFAKRQDCARTTMSDKKKKVLKKLRKLFADKGYRVGQD